MIYRARLDKKPDESMNGYLERINLVGEYKEAETEALIYLAQDGLYCPALGIKLSIEDSENRMNGRGINCRVEDNLSPLPEEYYEILNMLLPDLCRVLLRKKHIVKVSI